MVAGNIKETKKSQLMLKAGLVETEKTNKWGNNSLWGNEIEAKREVVIVQSNNQGANGLPLEKDYDEKKNEEKKKGKTSKFSISY